MPEENEIKPPVCRTLLEYMLYKIDRTIAILGLIAIGIWAMVVSDMSEPAAKIIGSVVTGLSMYLGVRLGSNK